MQKSLLNLFIKSKIIEKIILFAKMFDLDITNYKVSNITKENKLYLFNGEDIIGTINLNNFNSISTVSFDFIFVTPLLNITGSYKDSNHTFTYNLEKEIEWYDKAYGRLEVNTNINAKNDSNLLSKYLVNSYLTLRNNNGNYIHTRFTPAKFEIRESNNNVDEVYKYTYDNKIIISHEKNNTLVSSITINDKIKEERLEIEIKSPKGINIIPLPYDKKTNFNFLKTKINLIDLDVLINELLTCDPELINFIDHIKNILFIVSDNQHISLYDNMANLTLKNQNMFKFTFANPKDYELKNNEGIKR